MGTSSIALYLCSLPLHVHVQGRMGTRLPQVLNCTRENGLQNVKLIYTGAYERRNGWQNVGRLDQ